MDTTEYLRRRAWQKQAESEGRVADSMEVRLAIMDRFHNGEITLEEAQTEVMRLKRGAKRNGQITRNQAFRGH